MSGPAAERQIARLLAQGGVVVLTGAGLSTGRGIPDYRDHEGRWKRAQPVEHRDFLGSAEVRRRYWARSFLGWPTIGLATPGPGHRALAALELRGILHMTITQNVDGLHQKAGSQKLLELHGAIARVVCLDCGSGHARAEVQAWMRAANPDFAPPPARTAPDGDADLADGFDAGFVPPACPACDGMLKPDVVFFGDNVPRPRVEAAMAAVEQASGLLVVGSSLMVYSGYRFAERAHRLGKPVMAINLGTTRADALLTAKLALDCDEALARLVQPEAPA